MDLWNGGVPKTTTQRRKSRSVGGYRNRTMLKRMDGWGGGIEERLLSDTLCCFLFGRRRRKMSYRMYTNNKS